MGGKEVGIGFVFGALLLLLPTRRDAMVTRKFQLRHNLEWSVLCKHGKHFNLKCRASRLSNARLSRDISMDTYLLYDLDLCRLFHH